MKLSRGTSAFIAGSALLAGLAGSAVTFTPPAFAASTMPAQSFMQNVTNDPPLTHPVTITARTMAVRATVATFNDGFTDAKRDDCQQGFAPACAWLHRKPGLPAWFHVIPAPAKVARSACGRLPAVEVWTTGRDGFVVCRNDRVVRP